SRSFTFARDPCPTPRFSTSCFAFSDLAASFRGAAGISVWNATALHCRTDIMTMRMLANVFRLFRFPYLLKSEQGVEFCFLMAPEPLETSVTVAHSSYKRSGIERGRGGTAVGIKQAAKLLSSRAP